MERITVPVERLSLSGRRMGGKIQISGRIPANTSADLKLPDGAIEELGNGKFEVTVKMTGNKGDKG